MTKKVTIKLENGFVYNGTKISVDENGYFVAYVNGNTYRKPSLISLKQSLTHVAKLAAFDAYEEDRKTGKLIPVKIAEIVSYGRGSKAMKTTDGRIVYHVVKAGPGVVKAWTKWKAFCDKEDKRRTMIGKQKEKLAEGFQYVNVYNVYDVCR